MGRAKAMMMEHQENLAAATHYLVSKGHLQQCPVHETIYGGGNYDLSEGDFYKFAMADRKRGDTGPAPWALAMEPRDFTDALKEAYEEHPADECGYCAKIRAE